MSTEDFEVEQAPDDLRRRAIMAVTIASMAITAAALILAWGLLEVWGKKEPERTPPVAPRTIGTLEQTLVLDTKRGIDLRNEQTASLQRWRWVDQDAGLAQIPIDTAIDVIAREAPPPDRPLFPAPGREKEGAR